LAVFPKLFFYPANDSDYTSERPIPEIGFIDKDFLKKISGNFSELVTTLSKIFSQKFLKGFFHL